MACRWKVFTHSLALSFQWSDPGLSLCRYRWRKPRERRSLSPGEVALVLALDLVLSSRRMLATSDLEETSSRSVTWLASSSGPATSASNDKRGSWCKDLRCLPRSTNSAKLSRRTKVSNFFFSYRASSDLGVYLIERVISLLYLIQTNNYDLIYSGQAH